MYSVVIYNRDIGDTVIISNLSNTFDLKNTVLMLMDCNTPTLLIVCSWNNTGLITHIIRVEIHPYFVYNKNSHLARLYLPPNKHTPFNCTPQLLR